MGERAPQEPSAAGPATPPRRRLRWLRVIFKGVLWTVAILVLLVLLVFGFLQTEPGRELVKGFVLDTLNATFRGRVECDRIGGFLPFSAEVEGFRVFDPDGGKVLEVARVTADFHPLELLDTTIHLSDVLVERPVVDIFDAKGRMALLRAFDLRVPPTDDTPSPWIVRFEGLRLDEGTIQGLVTDQDLALTDLALDLSLGLGPEGLRWPHLVLEGRPIGASEIARALGAPRDGEPGGVITVRSRGALLGDALQLDTFEVTAGPHAVVLNGTIGLGAPMVVELDLPALVIGLDRLPADVAAIIEHEVGGPLASAPGQVQGRGHLALAPDGELTLDLALDSPYGMASLQAAATTRDAGAPDTAPMTLGDWTLRLDLIDAVAPAGLRARMPAPIRGARADLHVDATGAGMPLAPGGRARVEVAIDERAPSDSGRLHATLVRIEDDPIDGAATFSMEIRTEALQLQPWLALVDEPEIVGEVGALEARGTLALPAVGVPRLGLAASFDLAASGRVLALGKTLSAPRLAGSANVQWDGVGLPVGRVDLGGVDLGFDLGGARSLELGFDVRARRDGVPELVGSVRAEGLRWDALSIDTLELPLELALEGLDEGRPLPLGKVRWRATGVDLGAQEIATTSGDLDLTADGADLIVRGALRTGKLDLGPALAAGATGTDLVIDARLSPGPDGAPVGGAIAARVSGEVDGARHGPRRVGTVRLEDVRVSLPRGPAGPIEIAGRSRLSGIVAPEATVDTADVVLDLALDPARGVPVGNVTVDAAGATLPNGRRIDSAHVEATATPDGRIAYTGKAAIAEAKASDKGSAASGVEAVFGGVLTLPGTRRAFEVSVDTLRLRRRGDLQDLLVLDGARLDRDGWIAVEGLDVRASRATGSLTVSGRFRPSDGAVDVTVVAERMVLASWIQLVREALVWAGLPSPEGLPDALGGELGLELRARGSLARPELSMTLTLAELAWGRRAGAGGKVELRLSPGDVALLAALHWHEGGDLSLRARLPATASLSPPSVAWDEAAPFDLALSIDEANLDEVLAWADALSEAGAPTGDELLAAAGVEDLEGALRFDLSVDGTLADPRLRTTLSARPLDIGNWKQGSVTMEGSARGIASSFRLVMADRHERTQAMIDIELPFALPAALRQKDPIAWVRAELEHKELAVDIDLPGLVIAETPLAGVLPDELSDLAAVIDLTLGGTLLQPILQGSISLTSPEASPVDLGFFADIGTQGDLVTTYFAAARPNGDPLLDGFLEVPAPGRVLEGAAGLDRLLEDPRLTFDLQTADIASADLWELNQAVGDLAVQLVPDGRVMLDVSARGGPEGLGASLMTRVRTIGIASADPAAPRRNAADDTRLAVILAPDMLTVDLLMLQEGRRVPEYLVVQLAAKVGARRLLGRDKRTAASRPLEDTPILGRVSAAEFRLEGFASAFRSVLGTSGGQLQGELIVSGTLASPRFEKSLVAQFQPIVVAPLGLSHDWATVAIEFENGTDWTVTVSELYDETRTTQREPVSRCGVEPPVIKRFDGTTQDFRKYPYVAVKVSGSIPTLDPARMTLDGCVGVRDYAALAKSDMRGRVDGELRLSGTVARPEVRGRLAVVEAVLAPKLASKTVRAIGTPLDVTLVRGEPVPPPERPERNPYKTSVLIDVEVDIPKDAVRLEPSLTQVYGEVRALLYPSGKLRIRTADGELGLVGTIDVPKQTVFLYGKEFTVDKDSRAVFAGDMTTDPQIFFTARYNIAHVDLTSIGLVTTDESEVVVRATGTPTDLRLRFSSTPAMDETNILSVIALGVPASGGEDIGEAMQTQLITAMMGMATLQFARDFQQRLKLDVLRIEARSADPADSRLTVGKRLAEDLFVHYYLDLAAKVDEDTHSGSLEYRLTRYLSLLGRGGDRGDVGLELNLRFQD